MRRKLSFRYTLAAVLLLPVAVAAQDAQGWRKLAPAGDIFSVSMPAPVAEQTMTNPDNPNVKMRVYQNEATGVFYYVAAVEVAGSVRINASTFQAFVAGFLDSYCKSPRQMGFNCETTYERPLSLNGYAGKQYKVRMSKETRSLDGVLRIYMTPKKFYALQTLGGKEDEALTGKFLNSFSLAGARPAAR